jgi:hypothetical protein
MLELFRCEMYQCRLTKHACAKRHQRGLKVLADETTFGTARYHMLGKSAEYDLLPCGQCPIGAQNLSSIKGPLHPSATPIPSTPPLTVYADPLPNSPLPGPEGIKFITNDTGSYPGSGTVSKMILEAFKA